MVLLILIYLLIYIMLIIKLTQLMFNYTQKTFYHFFIVDMLINFSIFANYFLLKTQILINYNEIGFVFFAITLGLNIYYISSSRLYIDAFYRQNMFQIDSNKFKTFIINFLYHIKIYLNIAIFLLIFTYEGV